MRTWWNYVVSVVRAVHPIPPRAFWASGGGGQAECTLGGRKVKRGRENPQIFKISLGITESRD